MEQAGQLDKKVKDNLVRNKGEMFAYYLIATATTMDSLKQVCSIEWD